jgi:hypothetical protein
LERIGGALVAAQIAWYAPIVNALGNAVREKHRPALAAKSKSPDPNTQIFCHAIQAGNVCPIGAKSA